MYQNIAVHWQNTGSRKDDIKITSVKLLQEYSVCFQILELFFLLEGSCPGKSMHFTISILPNLFIQLKFARKATGAKRNNGVLVFIVKLSLVAL